MKPASVVLRWPLVVNDEPQEIGGGQVLHVGAKLGELNVWTLEVEGDGSARVVRVVPTGVLRPVDVGAHIGSVVAGALVWHVFEVNQ